MIASNPTRERGTCLTPKGEVVALSVRLREATPDLGELEQHRMLMELRQLVDRYAPRPVPIA